MWILWLLFWILVIIGAGYWVVKYYSGDQSYWPSRNVVLLNHSTVASFFDRLTFKVRMHEVDQRLYKWFKDHGHTKFGGIIEMKTPVLFVLDLDLVKHVMVKDFDSFVNRRQIIDFEKTDPLLHKMLIMLKDQEWKDLRSTMSPTFTTGKIRRMYEIFDTSSVKMANFLRSKVKDGNYQVEVRDVFTRFTLDIISSAAFGLNSQNFGETDSEFCKMAKRIQKQSFLQMIKFALLLMFPKLFSALRIPVGDTKSNTFFADVTRKAIQHREITGEIRDDFLQLLIEASHHQLQEEDHEESSEISKNKTKLTETHILSQSILFFFAGFDTTESLLLFASYELAVNPEVQETLYQELREEYESNNSKLEFDLIMKMEYLDKFISEVLRKYPPGFRTERISSRPYKIPNSDLTLDKGTTVMVPIYAIHHDEEYYPDPEKFDPERFSPENKASRNPYAYMPFGVGPRNCIAMRFALAEGKAAIAHLVLNFQLEPVSQTPIPMVFSRRAEFKPEGGALHLSVKPR